MIKNLLEQTFIRRATTKKTSCYKIIGTNFTETYMKANRRFLKANLLNVGSFSHDIYSQLFPDSITADILW